MHKEIGPDSKTRSFMPARRYHYAFAPVARESLSGHNTGVKAVTIYRRDVDVGCIVSRCHGLGWRRGKALVARVAAVVLVRGIAIERRLLLTLQLRTSLFQEVTARGRLHHAGDEIQDASGRFLRR